MAHNDLFIARRYANAVFALAQDNNTLAEWKSDMQTLSRIWIESHLARRLDDSKLGNVRRLSEARSILGSVVSPLAVNLVCLLLLRGRVQLVPIVAGVFDEMVRQSEGRIQLFVDSALTLTDPQRDNLRQRFAHRYGQGIELIENVDPSIIGGLVLRVGDELIDASIAGRLRRVAVALSE